MVAGGDRGRWWPREEPWDEPGSECALWLVEEIGRLGLELFRVEAGPVRGIGGLAGSAGDA